MNKLSREEGVAVGAALVIIIGIFFLTGLSTGLFGGLDDGLLSEDNVADVPNAEDLEEAFDEARGGFEY